LTLHGHASDVWSVAFSPDGQRVLSAGGGANRAGQRMPCEVKIWDALDGQEVLTLYAPAAQRPSVAISPDGLCLAANGDNVVTVWDAAPLTAEIDEQREAVNVVRFLFAQEPDKNQVLARLRTDPTLSEPVRQLAGALVESFWRARIRREAEQAAQSRFSKLMPRPEVLDSLRADASLGEPVRREALAIAEQYVENAGNLDRASRAVVRRPGGQPDAYRRALDQAELACRLAPYEGTYHTTLALAQYRAGMFAEALATLVQAEKLYTAVRQTPPPTDLAVRAMAKFRRGQKDAAKAALDRLRDTLRAPNGSKDEEAQSLLREAEEMAERPPERP
jgi:hypothetical protein